MHTLDHLLSCVTATLRQRGFGRQARFARGRRERQGRCRLVFIRIVSMVQTWDDALRAGGYRVTPQRQLVLEAVARLEHATPEEIYGEVRQTARGVNVSTIYRTLELLEQLGLVKHSHIHHGAPSYHLTEHAQHVHLICRECEQVTEVDQTAVRPLVDALEESQGFATDVGHLTVFGICATCRA